MSKRIRIRSGYGDYTDNFPYKQELARCLRRSDHSTIPNIPNPMSTEQSHIYALDASRMPWGDYGCILLSGMTSHLERQNGLLQLERTGPFVPPISLPGIADIVVTNDFKHLLEGSGLTGFTFQPVIKKHIVFLEWEKWDKKSEEPLEYPGTGEPEDYILERAHSPELAQQIGDLWELCLEECAEVERQQIGPQRWDSEATAHDPARCCCASLFQH